MSKAADKIRALIRREPDDPYLFQRLGKALLRDRRPADALQAYERACELAPDDPFSYLYLGNLLEAWDGRRARDCYERAAELMPGLPAAYWCRGHLSRGEGRFADAEEAYRRAVEVDPADVQARELLAEWEKFVACVRGPRGLSFYLLVKTRPAASIGDADASSLLAQLCSRLGIETVYRQPDGADVDARMLAEELNETPQTRDEYLAYCDAAGLAAFDASGRPAPEAAQLFNVQRWGQGVLDVILPVDEAVATTAYRELVSFCLANELLLQPMLPPGAGLIDLQDPGTLPAGWADLMR